MARPSIHMTQSLRGVPLRSTKMMVDPVWDRAMPLTWEGRMAAASMTCRVASSREAQAVSGLWTAQPFRG